MKTNEIAGIGNHNTALFWEYDTRLGRRWNRDPVVKPWESLYGTFGGNPIKFADVFGDNKGDVVGKNDAVGAKGSPAPNGGVRNGDGSISGGESFCMACGANGENTWGLPEEHPLGGNGTMTLWQAAQKEIGRNDYRRERVNDVWKINAVWGGVGAAPLAGFAVAEVGAAVGLEIGSEMLWNGARSFFSWKTETNIASGVSDFAAQMYVNKGDIRKWNVLSTISATAFKSPFTASVPGGILNISWNSLVAKKDPVYNPITSLQTWKSIGLNTAGNMFGDHIEGQILGGMSELGIKSNGRLFMGGFIGQQFGDVPSGYIDDGTKPDDSDNKK